MNIKTGDTVIVLSGDDKGEKGPLPPPPPVHEILQARVLEWGAIAFSA